MKNAWLAAIQQPNGRICKRDKICSMHFHSSDFLAEVKGRAILKVKAVPHVVDFAVANIDLVRFVHLLYCMF